MSRFQKFVKYFGTERGRLTSLYCVGTVGIGVFCARWAPHSIALETYRENLACYKFGVERKLTDIVYTRFEKALDMVKDMDQLERGRYKMFCGSTMEPFHIGSYHSIWGCAIGLPANFDYETVDDIPKSEIVVKKGGRPEPIKFDGEMGKKLENGLVYTENEQIFAMLKEILACRTWQWPLNCLYSIVWVLSSYSMALSINHKLRLLQRPLHLRIFNYFLTGVFNTGFFCFATDATQMYYDAIVDKEIAGMGKQWAEAGASYYEKVLNRNIALREISGDFSMYTTTGNVNKMLRQTHMPLTNRRDFFQETLKKLQEAAGGQMTE